MKKKLRLLATFYRSYCFAALVFSSISVYIVAIKGFSTFNSMFWFKIITTAITVFSVSANRSNEFFYYQNLGLSKSTLWTITLIFDFILYFLAFTML